MCWSRPRQSFRNELEGHLLFARERQVQVWRDTAVPAAQSEGPTEGGTRSLLPRVSVVLGEPWKASTTPRRDAWSAVLGVPCGAAYVYAVCFTGSLKSGWRHVPARVGARCTRARGA